MIFSKPRRVTARAFRMFAILSGCLLVIGCVGRQEAIKLASDMSDLSYSPGDDDPSAVTLANAVKGIHGAQVDAHVATRQAYVELLQRYEKDIKTETLRREQERISRAIERDYADIVNAAAVQFLALEQRQFQDLQDQLAPYADVIRTLEAESKNAARALDAYPNSLDRKQAYQEASRKYFQNFALYSDILDEFRENTSTRLRADFTAALTRTKSVRDTQLKSVQVLFDQKMSEIENADATAYDIGPAPQKADAYYDAWVNYAELAGKSFDELEDHIRYGPFEALQDLISGVADSVSEDIASEAGAVTQDDAVNALRAVVQAYKTEVSAEFDNAGEAAQEALQGVSAGAVSSAQDRIGNFVDGLVRKAQEQLSGLLNLNR